MGNVFHRLISALASMTQGNAVSNARSAKIFVLSLYKGINQPWSIYCACIFVMIMLMSLVKTRPYTQSAFEGCRLEFLTRNECSKKGHYNSIFCFCGGIPFIGKQDDFHLLNRTVSLPGGQFFVPDERRRADLFSFDTLLNP